MMTARKTEPIEGDRPRKEVLDALARLVNEHGEALVRFHTAVAQRMGLSLSAYKALFMLRRRGAMSAGQIARETGLATASVTELIDRLAANGYVVRARDTTDRRRVVVKINEKAVLKARRAFGVPNPSLARLFEQYNVQELEVLADFLYRNTRRLRDDLANL